MKIFSLASHQEKLKTHGVDYVRIISPMKHLNGYKGTEVTQFDIEKTTDWIYVAQNYDAIYFNYLNNPWGYAAMGAMARKFGVKLIMDMDDNLWGIHKDNPAYSVYKKGGDALRNFTAICNDVDYITCTNEYLKHVIMNNTKKGPDKIKVFPNYIDLDVWKYKSKFKDDGQIILTHFGSTTHFEDLSEHQFVMGMDKIMKEYPNVTFRAVGHFLPKLKEKWGSRYENVRGDGDIYTWAKSGFPKFMEDTDILVTPLVDDIYNRCKSQIKWLEGSSAKIPGVWQDIRQYNEVVDGTNGILASTEKEWYRGLKHLIDNPKERKRMGENAYKSVKENWQIQDHVEEYYDFFNSL